MIRTLTSRRNFVKGGLSLGALASLKLVSPSSAIEPIKRTGTPRFLLSLAAYSFRQFLAPKNADDKKMSLTEFVDYCAENGCVGAELTSYYFPKDVTNEYLLKLKRHAFIRGVEVSGTAVGNTFTAANPERRAREIADVKKWVDHALVMGAPHIRVFAGTEEGNTKAEAKKLCIAALEECAEYAGQKGVFLGIENHGGIVAEANDLLDIIKTVRSPWVGINLDTGNFHTEDPYAEIERCAPYAVNVQFKVEIQARGRKKEEADLNRVLGILRRANYQGYVALEYEAAEDPWKTIPPLLQKMQQAIRS
jgi:sugar phosphate isomerase/epimerase